MQTLDIKGLLEKYPKTARVIIEGIKTFLVEMQKSMLNDVAEEERGTIDFPEIEEKVVMEFLEATIGQSGSLQMLIDIFDLNEIYVYAYWTDGGWETCVSNQANHSDPDTVVVGEGDKNRREAYIKAFPHAFEIFEKELNNQEK